MTQPPADPTGQGPSADASPTEPVPAVAPAPDPQAPGPGAPAFAFAPVEPEPGQGQAYAAPPAPAGAATPATRQGASSSRILPIAIGAALIVGAVGVAFAAGRATTPASDVTGGVSSRQEVQGRGNGDQEPGAIDRGGFGPMGGGPLPDASSDLDGGGRGSGGDAGGDGEHAFPGRGFGREGFGGLGITGTVTAVTEDSITIETEAGLTVTIGLDDATTYHQQAPAESSDVTTGTKVQVQLDGGVRPGQGSGGDINLGTAGDITIVP